MPNRITRLAIPGYTYAGIVLSRKRPNTPPRKKTGLTYAAHALALRQALLSTDLSSAACRNRKRKHPNLVNPDDPGLTRKDLARVNQQFNRCRSQRHRCPGGYDDSYDGGNAFDYDFDYDYDYDYDSTNYGSCGGQ